MAEILEVDRIRCDAHRLCAELLPELITLDDWGYPIVKKRAVPDPPGAPSTTVPCSPCVWHAPRSQRVVRSVSRFSRLLQTVGELGEGCPRSGIDRQIIGSIGPVYSSSMLNLVVPFAPGERVGIRTP